jgi:hypothetical protein
LELGEEGEKSAWEWMRDTETEGNKRVTITRRMEGSDEVTKGLLNSLRSSRTHKNN